MQMVMMVFRTSLENEVLPWIEQEQLPYTRMDGAASSDRRSAFALSPGYNRAPYFTEYASAFSRQPVMNIPG